MGSHRKWEHCYDLSGACPICGQPAHVGQSLDTNKKFWLHDDPDMRRSGAHASRTLAYIDDDEYESLVDSLGYSPDWS